VSKLYFTALDIGDSKGGEASAAHASEIGVETLAGAIVSAVERRCVNGPFPPGFRQRYVAELERRDPALRHIAPPDEARAFGERHADEMVAYLKREQAGGQP
jgi:hypothetical protein